MNQHSKNLLIDAHSDILSLDVTRKRALGRRSVFENDWVPRMRQASIDARVLSIYVDDAFLPEMALRKALDQVSALYSEAIESPGICICVTSDDIREAKERGKIGLVLGMEGVEPLVNDINLLQVFYKLGLRVMGLTHSRRNYAADGCLFVHKHAGRQGGLTNFGVDLIQEACDLGIVIDVSHLNDAGFWDVINCIDSPIIASHSNCKVLCDNPRNLTDEQIRAIADRKGVVAVTSVPLFVDKKIENADVYRIIDHIDHIVDITNIKSVALGFDFYEYGVKYLSEEEKMRLPRELRTFLPTNITKDEDVPNLIETLTRHGYCEKDVRLILGENLLRVFDEVCAP